MREIQKELADLGRLSLLRKYKGSKYHIKKLLSIALKRRQIFYELKKFKELAAKHGIEWNEELPSIDHQLEIEKILQSHKNENPSL